MTTTQLKVRLGDLGATLLAFLAARLQLSNHKAKALLDARRVFVNGHRVWMAKHRLDPGDRVEFQQETSVGPAISREIILYESSDYLIANKPPGMLSNGSASLESALSRLLDDPELTAAHRLDRDTSGCLLFARHAQAEARIRQIFIEHRIRKIYHAIVSGLVPDSELAITHPIDHRSARTLIRTLDANKRASHLRIEIETGRTHQIRRHLVSIGHPLIGDQQYATRRQISPDERVVWRQMLHAYELAFQHPVTGKIIRAKAPLPDDFSACLRKFGLT